jgi:hypothetical protein
MHATPNSGVCSGFTPDSLFTTLPEKEWVTPKRGAKVVFFLFIKNKLAEKNHIIDINTVSKHPLSFSWAPLR